MSRFSQVDDCINKFHWMKSMSTQAANLKKQGVDLPKTPEEAVKKFGSLSDFQRQQPGYKPQAGTSLLFRTFMETLASLLFDNYSGGIFNFMSK